jgi:hypothetical protein
MTNTPEEETIETASQETMDKAARWYYSEIMRQLMDSERFCTWFGLNFDVHKLIDEEAKSIEIRVLEVHPDLVLARMQDQMKEEMKKAAKEDSGIVSATSEDLKTLESMKRRKR